MSWGTQIDIFCPYNIVNAEKMNEMAVGCDWVALIFFIEFSPTLQKCNSLIIIGMHIVYNELLFYLLLL